MRDTLKAVSRFYLIGVIWFVVLVGTSLALMGSMGTLYAALDLSPAIRTVVTLGVAFSVASMAARLAWSQMRVARRHGPQASHARGELSDGGSTVTLVAPRTGIRL